METVVDNDLLKVIGEKLRELRESNNLSQKDVADRLGVGQTIVAYWEKGERELKATMIDQLATFYQVTPNYLLGYEDSLLETNNRMKRVTQSDMEMIEAILNDKDFIKILKGNPEETIQVLKELHKNHFSLQKKLQHLIDNFS